MRFARVDALWKAVAQGGDSLKTRAKARLMRRAYRMRQTTASSALVTSSPMVRCSQCKHTGNQWRRLLILASNISYNDITTACGLVRAAGTEGPIRSDERQIHDLGCGSEKPASRARRR